MRAVIYVRISDDREGQAAGVGRQEADSRALAERLGWQVADVVIENDTSAFKRRRVRRPNGRTELRVMRPGFQRMLELLDSGAADGLIAYDLDRTARDPRDLEDLIDIVEQRTPRLPVMSVSGSLRLDNDADVTMARVMVAVANKSSRDTQRRVARKHQEIAESGRYAGGGNRRYGYEKDGTTIREDEAAAIREAVDRLLAGESANSIARDFDSRGIKPVKAERWAGRSLIGILGSARIAGLRVYQGEVLTKATWPAIIDEETRDRVLAQLELNSRGLGKPVLRYWANKLLFCGRCGEPLYGAQQVVKGRGASSTYRYWCAYTANRSGCGRIGIDGVKVEAEVRRQVLAYLDRPDVAMALSQATSGASIEATRKALAEDERDLKALARAHGNKQISLAEWLEARAPIEARLKVHTGVLRSVAPRSVQSMLGTRDRPAQFDALDPVGKHELVAAVLEPAGYAGWTVAPADMTKPRAFDPTRLSLTAA